MVWPLATLQMVTAGLYLVVVALFLQTQLQQRLSLLYRQTLVELASVATSTPALHK
jgi:hypothetical protein